MLEVLDIEQGTDDWLQARAGIPTASRFKDVLAKGQGKMRAKYLHELAGEIITGRPMDTYSNGHMERGHDQEPEARSAYAFLHDVEPEQVGFIRNGRKGCSPDSLISTDGMLEIKSKLPHLMVETIKADKFPSEHRAQCQGGLWVAEREWIDLAVYCPGFPLFVKREHRDSEYIANLESEVARFLEDLDTTVEAVRAYGRAA